MAAHRYWRLLCHTGSGGGVFAVAELSGRNVTGGVNQFVGGTPIESSNFGGYPAALAFDGNINTNWASNTLNNGEYIGYDLGAANPQDIMEIVVTARNDGNWNQVPATADWQYSDDAVTWTTYFTANSTHYGQGISQRFSNIPVPNNIPEVAQLVTIGVESVAPANMQVTQLVAISVISGPPNSISLNRAFKLPCWQPCTAFGTESIVIRFK